MVFKLFSEHRYKRITITSGLSKFDYLYKLKNVQIVKKH